MYASFKNSLGTSGSKSVARAISTHAMTSLSLLISASHVWLLTCSDKYGCWLIYTSFFGDLYVGFMYIVPAATASSADGPASGSCARI